MKDGAIMKHVTVSKKALLLLVAVNLICFSLIVVLFVNYNTSYKTKLYRQNISNIENLNRSSGTVAQAMFGFQSHKIRDIACYIEAEHMNLNQVIIYLSLMNNDASGALELVGTDYTGYISGGGDNDITAPISYKDSTYAELHSLFSAAKAGSTGDVDYTPEFTDAYSAFRSFAFYTYVGIKGESETSYYTLMLVSRSDEMMEKIQQRGSYDELSTALIDNAGNYIMRNPNFKSNNFFKYIYVFNELTLDEKNVLSGEVMSSANGTLRYKDSEGRECVFLYNRLADESWYSVSCVPLETFDNFMPGNQLTILVTALLSVMLIADILWLNRLNRRLKQSVEREKKANNAKTEFLSRMSHDIRTPLNAILGFVAIMRDSSTIDPIFRANLNKIDVSGRYLLGIINDVLDMSKIESGKVELHVQNTDYAALLSGVLEIFSGEAERKGIDLCAKFSLNEVRFLMIDPLRIRQIFSNLLSNAIKFSNSGTTVWWTAEEKRLESGLVQVVSTVTDQGCGMTPEFLKNVFEPFSQEQNIHSGETPGTGLGLSIVNRLVNLMGGTVAVKSEPGHGSAFTVTLSFPEGEDSGVQRGTGIAEICGETGLQGKRILLCEDNSLNREIAVTLLTSKGAICEEAENGKTGLEMFVASPVGYYDAILMDIRMPVMSGLKASAAIRALDRKDAQTVPIIAMTANAYDEDIQECLGVGMNAHLSKPFEPEQLFKTLERYMTAGKT